MENKKFEKNYKTDIEEVIDVINSKNLRKLTDYLTAINKNAFFFLVYNHVKLARLDKDDSCRLPIMILFAISKGYLEMDYNDYRDLFFIALEYKDFPKARIYLNIIKGFARLGVNSLEVEKLEDEYYNIHSEYANKAYEEDLIKRRNEMINNQDFFYVKSKIDELYNGKSVVLLKNMKASKKNEIIYLIKNYSDIVAFAIGDEGNKRFVLRKRKLNGNFVDFNEMRKKYREKFNNGDYEGALRINKILLSNGTPKANIYANMGFCLLKMRRFEAALDYFIISSELYKQQGKENMYSNIITDLKYYVEHKTFNKYDYYFKPDFVMHEEEFLTDNEKINPKYIEDLAALILDGDYSLEDGIKYFNFDLEEALIARLIYVRDCYYLERYEEGDKYLRKVEKIKNKSSKVKELLFEVKKNKKFYKNRLKDNEKCLVFRKYN